MTDEKLIEELARNLEEAGALMATQNAKDALSALTAAGYAVVPVGQAELLSWVMERWSDTAEARQKLDAALSAHRSEGGWRPIADEGPNCPGFNVPVLLGWRHFLSGEWEYEAGEHHFGRKDISECWHGQATHWQPLPLPPPDKGDQSDD